MQAHKRTDSENIVASPSSSCVLQAGETLQLQFIDDPGRGLFKVTVIGYVEGCSLIISAPKSNGHILLLREGQQFSVRLLSGKQIIGFESEVIKVYNNPFAYVHLKPPAEVMQYNVRNAYRVQINNIASVQLLEDDSEMSSEETASVKKQPETIAGKIVDMSTTGCLLKLIKKVPGNNNSLHISTKVTVAEQERLLNFEAVICSHREIEENNRLMHLYGMQFMDMNDDKRLLLHCYVNERLVHELFKD